MEKEKVLENKDQLEKSISFSCQEIPDIIKDMFVEDKILRLWQIIADLKKENEELQSGATLSTLLE